MLWFSKGKQAVTDFSEWGNSRNKEGRRVQNLHISQEGRLGNGQQGVHSSSHSLENVAWIAAIV